MQSKKTCRIDVFGLPSKGDRIVEGTTLNDREKLLEMYNIDSGKKIYLQDLLNELPKIDAKSNEFKAKFLLYAIGCLLCPWSATYVETAWFSYLNEKVLKGDVDWASHVYKMLCSGIEEFQRCVGRQYVSGCIIILQVIYADIVSGNQDRRCGCRPCKSLATLLGVQEMNTLISSIDDYGIERKDLREELNPYHHDGERDEFSKEKNCSKFFGDDNQNFPMEEDYVGSSPTAKVVDGDGKQHFPMEEDYVRSSPKAKGVRSSPNSKLE
ncbi:hypothetical protein COLO4_10271 [Corchorus olitorius]|uniref:Aminotransferase-like plant mobile domain-containing protein n=1 Tax=Corchorus olitorius TaxID=93759 RepID=A0A1R3K9F7_9ROSI|nr:hypothetical protein COLO4_10271 [Corchorus olitorius]